MSKKLYKHSLKASNACAALFLLDAAEHLLEGIPGGVTVSMHLPVLRDLSSDPATRNVLQHPKDCMTCT